MAVLTSGAVVRRIVNETNLDGFAERVVDSFWERPEFQAVHPPRREVLAWVRWNLDLVIRWLIDARPPTEAELEVFREQARARAAAGTPVDIVPANFRRGARFASAPPLPARRRARPAHCSRASSATRPRLPKSTSWPSGSGSSSSVRPGRS